MTVSATMLLSSIAVRPRIFPRSARVISKLNWTSGIVTTGFAVHNYAIK
jgi:hypothetical protein